MQGADAVGEKSLLRSKLRNDWVSWRVVGKPEIFAQGESSQYEDVSGIVLCNRLGLRCANARLPERI